MNFEERQRVLAEKIKTTLSEYDGVLLMARLNVLTRQYRLGLIDNSAATCHIIELENELEKYKK